MLEANLYQLLGLETVSTSYRLFEITGSMEHGPEYYAGVTRLVRQLSRAHQQPFTAIRRGEVMMLAAPENACSALAEHHNLVRWVATLKSTGEPLEIDCAVSGDELDPIRIRFLHFMLQAPLFRNRNLWQPRAGDAFFHRDPVKCFDGISMYEGMSVRVTSYPGGGFGVLLDLKSKLISKRAVGTHPDQDTARRLKNSSCLYKMGDLWYEIKISGLATPTVSAPILFDGSRPVSLKEYLHENAQGVVPPSLAQLDGDGAVLNYRGADTASVKAAPAELCFPVLDTHSKRGARHQSKTVLPPHVRKAKVSTFKKTFLQKIMIGNANLSLADKPAKINEEVFDLPDLLFGSDMILPGLHANQQGVDPLKYAKQRRQFLESADKGFFETSTFDPQILVLPKSVMNSWGCAFVSDFIGEVQGLYPAGKYDPRIVEFDDLSTAVSTKSQAEAILRLAFDGDIPAGDAAIMVHHTKGKARDEEQLPAFLINELRRLYGVNAAVFHSKVPGESYRHESREEGARYVRRKGDRGRYSGYLKGAALNKVLLPNGKWPFVLSGELISDLVIGIDVKHFTAAMVLVAEGGRAIHQKLRTSKRKEKLPSGIVKEMLIELIAAEASQLSTLAKTITVHRDGRVWPTEINGLQAACEALAEEGLIDPDWSLDVFEVSKSSPSPFRMFEIENRKGQKPLVNNPRLGSWCKLSEEDGYICTTGAPMIRRGTARPLHVRRAYGSMNLIDALGDIFRLSCLSWTRPESCSRLPVSLKLCDTLLMDEGADHDVDQILHANDDEEVNRA